MTHRFFGLMIAAPIAALVSLTAPAAQAGQAQAAAPPVYTPPKTADGQPNLQGIWQVVRGIESNVSELVLGQSRLEAKLTGLDTKVTGLEKKVQSHDKRFDDHDKRFDAIDKRFEEVDRRFDAVDRKFDELEARLDAKIDGVEERLTRRMDGIDGRLDRFGEQLVAIAVAVGATGADGGAAEP